MAEFHGIVEQELCDLGSDSLSPWARFHMKVLDSVGVSRESLKSASQGGSGEGKLISGSGVPVPPARRSIPAVKHQVVIESVTEAGEDVEEEITPATSNVGPHELAAFMQRVEESIRTSNHGSSLAESILILQEMVASLNDVGPPLEHNSHVSGDDDFEDMDYVKSVMTQTTPLSLSRESSEDPLVDDGSNHSLQQSVDSNRSAVESGIGTNSPLCLGEKRAVVSSDSSNESSDEIQWKNIRRRHSCRRVPSRRREMIWVKRDEPLVTHKPPPHKVTAITLQSFCTPSPASSTCPVDSAGSGGSAFNTLDSSRNEEVVTPEKFSEKVLSASVPTLKSSVTTSPQMVYVDKGSVSAATTPADGNKTFEESILNARSSSVSTLAEIEASEACRWLRAAGFPQYAQMYQDSMFPVDLSGARADHAFLDIESLNALFRRLEILNRASKLRMESCPRRKIVDSDDEDNTCAISNQWTYQRQSRRWSRISPSPLPGDLVQNDYDDPETYRSETPDYPKRTSSERIREGARSWLRRMESFRSRSARRKPQQALKASDIGTPQLVDLCTMDNKLKSLNCVNVDALSTVAPNGNDSGLDSPDCNRRVPQRRSRRLFRKKHTSGSVSDPECAQAACRTHARDANSNDTRLIGCYVEGESPDYRKMSCPDDIVRRSQVSRQQLTLDLKPDPASNENNSFPPPALRHSDDTDGRTDKWSPLVIRNSNFHESNLRKVSSGSSQSRDLPLSGTRKNSRDLDLSEKGSDLQSQGSSGSIGVHCDSDLEGSLVLGRDATRWNAGVNESYPSTPENVGSEAHVPIATLSVGQMILARKVALLRLTGIMEAHAPNYKGLSWAWDIPKFLKKMRPSDHREKGIFGSPLYLNVQKWGIPMPPVILDALKFLRREAMDQVGLFRKPGVKSRIASLRRDSDSGKEIEFDPQQAFDVADLVKQYFRDLPEALLTNKLSETFIAIFQALPNYLRLEATRYALLLLPDEHREALQILLSFLLDITSMSSTNQMTSSNVAVCFAPSLFHLSHNLSPRSTSASPRRRTKASGTPDPRELAENKAAHDCMLLMLREHNQLFQLPQEFLANCQFSYLDESVPVSLAELRTEKAAGWKAYHDACFAALLREAKEKSKGWVHTSHPDPSVELSYKKVGDGHALRIWRASISIPAPPTAILSCLLHERHLYCESIVGWRNVEKLDPDSDVTQYFEVSADGQDVSQSCLLRSWRTNLFSGGSALVETSIEHGEARIVPGAVHRILLASRYLVEPCGAGHSKLTYLSRIDLRGRSPEWYNKVYGHLIVQNLRSLRTSFHIAGTLPETTL